VKRLIRSFGWTLVASLLAPVVSGVIVVRGQVPDPAAPKTTDELLRAAPFDRVTLIDGTVLIVDPVSPRPLPTPDPAKEREKRRQRERKNEIPLEGNIEVGKKAVIEMPDEKKEVDPNGLEEDDVRLHLLQGGPREIVDFKTKRASIKKVEYFEDLLMDESDRLVKLHEYTKAFECCLRVQTRNPGWKGLFDRVNFLLYMEGRKALIDGDGDRGLRLLRELLARKRDYEGLLDQIGEAYGKRIERALSLGLYPRARRVLHELTEVVPDHILVKQMRAIVIKKAADRAKASEGAPLRERLDGLTEALRIWPTLDGTESLYNKAFLEEPTLEVAVNDVSAPLGPWIRTPADQRISRLLYRPILLTDDDAARQGKKPGQLGAAIESSDLGRRLVVKIRPGFHWSDGSRPVSAIDVGRDLIDRTDPHSLRFDARWANLLDRVEVVDETKLELRLNHSPLKGGAWLLGPVGPAHAGFDGRVTGSGRDRPLVTDGLFICTLAGTDRVELRLREDVQPGASAAAGGKPGGGPAASAKFAGVLASEKMPAPDRSNGPAEPAAAPENGAAIKRIREIRFPSGQSAVGALRRGDVSMIEHVPPDLVLGLAASPEIKVAAYANPVIHLLAIDGRNPALRSRSLRRGLSYALDRKALLEDYLIKRPAEGLDAQADGPFPRGCYADATGVKPLEVQMWLAKMLVAAARKEMNNARIKLNFEYPSIPEVRAIVPRIADAFRDAGVEIVPIELPPSQLEGELRGGRRFDLAYRVLECREPVLEAGLILCPGYDSPPEADALASVSSKEILWLLLQLERASDWTAARGLAQQVDRESRDELPIIPLWQVADHYAWRDRLEGPGKGALDLYQDVQAWKIVPWVAKDSWEKP
jgi:peptide/nickel transport system substrate-binding protein